MPYLTGSLRWGLSVRKSALRLPFTQIYSVSSNSTSYHARTALRLYQEFAADEPHIKVWQEMAEATKEIVKAAEEDWEKEHGTIPPESTEEKH